MLTAKQQRFVLKYLEAGNATNAARLAGYSEKTASAQGARLLKHVQIRELLARQFAALKREFEETEKAAGDIMRQLARLGFNDPRGFFDENGDAIPVQQLSEAQAAAIAGFEVVLKNAKAGDGHTDTVLKYKLVPKVPALELLAKIMKLVNNVPSDAPLVSIFQVNCLPALSPDPEIEKARAELTAGAIDV